MRALTGLWSGLLNRVVFVVALALSGSAAHGGEHTIEGGGIWYDLSDDFADTYGEYIRARFEYSLSDAFYTDITNLDRFGDDGTQITVGNVHQFTDRVYTNISVAGSSGGFFWPRMRIDGSISYKWLPDKTLITTIGGGYFDAKDVHEDTRGFIDLTYYIHGPWVVHAGFQINVSDPGSVDSEFGYVGTSYVDNKTRIVSARGSFGEQAYQATAANNFVVDFEFHSVRVTWREWVGNTWGINVAAEHYASDVYDQSGFELGFFKEF